MDTVSFAIFKFKNIEGVDVCWRPTDFTHSKYSYAGKVASIEYDFPNEAAIVTWSDQASKVKFEYLQEFLKARGFFNESPEEYRHSSSFGKK